MPRKKPRQLLIDGDVIIHQSCLASQFELEDEQNEIIVMQCNLEEAFRLIRERIDFLLEASDAESYKFCLSSGSNFRKDLDPSYKAHRKSTRKPLGFSRVRSWTEGDPHSVSYPRVEADDTLGILATIPNSPWEPVIWSIDKDLMQIPGLHLSSNGEEVSEVTPRDGEIMHLYQTLVGDTADGYPGCPGIGPVQAGELAVGGWDYVLDAFEDANLTEEDALLQARLAFILQHNYYNTSTHKVKAWKP